MILAIDTAGPWVAVAVSADGTPAAGIAVAARLNHNEILAGMVRHVFTEAGVERPDSIAIDVGPGSFTGTRVGVSFAMGLARGWDIPVATRSSFQVAANLAPPDSKEAYVAFPIVGSEWCRARLLRTGSGWHEAAIEELTQETAISGCDDIPLIVPWGDATTGIQPPSNWNAAVALAAMTSDSPDTCAPGDVRVRYVGPSQAERNFHARKKSR